jgi:hypothetical protein
MSFVVHFLVVKPYMSKKPDHIELSTIHPRLSLKNEMVEREAVRANLLGLV